MRIAIILGITATLAALTVAANRRYYRRPRDPDDPEETMPII